MAVFVLGLENTREKKLFNLVEVILKIISDIPHYVYHHHPYKFGKYDCLYSSDSQD